METNSLFVVEDEPSIAQAVQFALQAEGFHSQHFTTGSSCLAALADHSPALILLDIGLSDGNGFEFFGKIRQLSDAPIIYMTARSSEIDRVAGLEMGADDYIVKPFSVRELVARVRVVLRRMERSNSRMNNQEVYDTIFSIDTERKRIYFHQQLLNLTLHEYRLLETLLNQPERVFTRSELLEHGWQAPDHRLERTIDSHIKSLRNKLHQIAPHADPITTHRGIGYSLSLH